MRSTKKLYELVFILIAIGLLAGCAAPTPTATLQPSDTPTPTATATATPVPYYVSAEVWAGDLQVPVMLWHRFGQETHDDTTVWVKRSTFKAQLQRLYDAGFSLVSLSSWLDGSFSVPAGRRPLIITLDDGFFADQIYINPDGTPSEYSGIGILWQFAQDHPDFGFAASIFADVGDKYYGDIQADDWFYVSDGDAWKTKLGETIAWGLENGVDVYSHTYQHVDLSLTEPNDITLQLQLEDKTVRQFLALAGRSDLNDRLGNMIALPFGVWPATDLGMVKLKTYKNPEGLPVQAIFEAYNSTEAKLTPSLFSEGFDPLNLPRITATDYSVDWVIENAASIPAAAECKLGPTEESMAGDAGTLQSLISSAVQSGTCPEGVYQVNGFIFVAKDGAVTQYQ